ncbi:MAG: 2,3-bisphosphoglycerate-independent phosphoglycerate mutase [Candidatus Heimdallarchaeota archaeon LC_2]|nr:MAG: 2,3-bisphosphoglycerate-independent phosphoglycerate mutase [Candidatus Heimdallarchaeota archaeon LC_2]
MAQTIVLVIIDGFGIAPISKVNAISQADMPTWEYLNKKYSSTELDASGNSVGLPDNIMGNSEVGHLTIGSGRINFQSLELINRSCVNGSLARNNVIQDIIRYLRNSNGRLHLMGLLSDGGVHSSQYHLETLLTIFNNDLSNSIFIHAITDGRDTPPSSSVKYIKRLDASLEKMENTKLATIIGRFYAMDRDKKWDRTKIAYDLYLNGVGESSSNPYNTVKIRYSENETDEFLKPILINPEGIMKEGDAILFYNFRPDRARQITMAINGEWDHGSPISKKILFTTMTSYVKSWQYPVLFDAPTLKNSLAEIISIHGMKQTHIGETEKYAHVTYFLNGGNEKDFPNEYRILIPSLKVETYDMQPSMSTLEIAEMTKNTIEGMDNEFIVVNIAAPDMVGHTGKLEATIQALEVTDKALKLIYESCKTNNYTMIITSDHGNCELMESNGLPHTAHTTNKVPFLITGNYELNQNFGLSNIAPTILELMKVPIPYEMTSKSLIIK